MLETLGWDTHNAQQGRLANQLKNLDAMLAAMRDGLGSAWANTTVLVATEFGRTVAVNGTGGTDHGTGSVAMLVGGAVKGGRIIADWPGLTPASLYQARDLRPTSALDALIAGAATESMALDPERVGRSVFVHATSDRPMAGLIRALSKARGKVVCHSLARDLRKVQWLCLPIGSNHRAGNRVLSE